jgi:exopolysaccharide biosynthesis WecB/TagA/CpsF family protein
LVRKRIISFDIDTGSYGSFINRIIARAESGEPGYVCVANVHMVIEAYDDPSFAKVIDQAFLVTPDGMPLVKAMRLLHGINQERVAGMDLFPDLLAVAESRKLSVLFLGSTAETLQRVVSRVTREYPDLNIVGSHSPPFRPLSDEDEATIIGHIRQARPHLVFVALGCPKQEKFMARLNPQLNSVMLGVGGAFPVFAGIQKRAPRWMQHYALEWVYRLLQEPRRLWRRYTYTNLKFLALLVREFWRLRSEQPDSSTPLPGRESSRQIEKPTLAILGTRGIPARHGGFETFAEQLALYLASRGWNVTVYCQKNGADRLCEEYWQGVRLVHIPVNGSDTIGSIIFDWKSTLLALREKSLVLTLGYNTALFSFVYRLAGVTNLINMDGFEWRRKKWSLPQRAWLYLNERFACLVANHLIADHPEIQTHLSTRVSSKKITMIPYGADVVAGADATRLHPFGLEPDGYALVIARPEPENSILEIVEAFSARKRGYKLVLVGAYDPARYPYHAKVTAAAGNEVVILGAIYDRAKVAALRYYCRMYIHGHRVGGTNPSLIEALAAGSPVLAQDNRFNRWVAGPAAHYFKDQAECSAELDRLLLDKDLLARMRNAGRERCEREFSAERVLVAYEELLRKWWDKDSG